MTSPTGMTLALAGGSGDVAPPEELAEFAVAGQLIVAAPCGLFVTYPLDQILVAGTILLCLVVVVVVVVVVEGLRCQPPVQDRLDVIFALI